MTIEEYLSYEQKDLYNLSFNGVHVGPAIEEKVMRKLVKLQCEYDRKIKEILLNNIDDVYHQGWTLNTEGLGHEQTSVRFTQKESYWTKEDFIKSFSLYDTKKRRYFLNLENSEEATKIIDFELEYFKES